MISAEIINAGENPTLEMTVNGQKVNAVYADGRLTYTPAADMTDGRTNVTVTVTRADGKTASFNWFFTVGQAQYQLYFGQLHSHTQYSDGARLPGRRPGLCEEPARKRQCPVRGLHRPLQLL